MLKISEAADKTGLSVHTLRFYEKNGLINASHRSEAGYRLYTKDDVRKAMFIRLARNTGFSLEEIATLLSIRLDKESHSCQEVTDITSHKLEEVNEKIRELTSMKTTLETLLASCCGGPEQATHCSIMEALDDNEIEFRNSSDKAVTHKV